MCGRAWVSGRDGGQLIPSSSYIPLLDFAPMGCTPIPSAYDPHPYSRAYTPNPEHTSALISAPLITMLLLVAVALTGCVSITNCMYICTMAAIVVVDVSVRRPRHRCWICNIFQLVRQPNNASRESI